MALSLARQILRKSHINYMRMGRNTYFAYANELSHPLDRKPCNVCPAEAVKCIQSGDVVFCSGAAATPIVLIEAMVEHAKANCLQGITVCHMHTEGPATYCNPEYADMFRSNSFFMGGNVRKAVAEGRGDNYSIFLHEIPKLFYRKIIQPDVSMIHVSPPDRHGYSSLGTSVDCVRAACLHSKKIIAQVNKQMPRTFGDACIHISHFDSMTEVDVKLPQHNDNPDENDMLIGKHIAENLVCDGATLQMGIGVIPDAVLSKLHKHKDLGIHSEMFANGVVDLVKAGAVTNRHKKRHQGRIVGSFMVGNEALYDFVDDNPYIEMYAVDYVNSVSVIKQLHRMTAINSCIECDLTGQVCSDSIGARFYSGFGGQVDFIRGAAEGIDGKGMPIIAMPSATTKGVSKIVPMLKTGAGVVTSRAHVHYVVTEHGIASLFGKNMRQRAYELIQIAHPDHREELDKAARDRLKVVPSKC